VRCSFPAKPLNTVLFLAKMDNEPNNGGVAEVFNGCSALQELHGNPWL
jgi:hypothetical protein